MALRRRYLTLVIMLSAACYLQLLLMIQQTDFNTNDNVLKSVSLPSAEKSRHLAEDSRHQYIIQEERHIVEEVGNFVKEHKHIVEESRHIEQELGNLIKKPEHIKEKAGRIVDKTKPIIEESRYVGNRNISILKEDAAKDSRSVVQKSVNPNNGTVFNFKPTRLDDKRKHLDSNVFMLKQEIDLQKSNIAERTTVKNESHRCHRNVHLWAERAGELGFNGGIHLIECPGSFCDVQLTVDRSYGTMKKNEALVLFHWSPWDWDELHNHRPPGQKWVFYTLESPRHTRKHVIPPDKYYNTTYDYIMTFRYDSDFRADYGQYIPGKPEIDVNDNRNWAKDRSKLVAWMASNCRHTSWPREDFVERLSRYIPVDIYGRCGNLTCKPGTQKCDRTLGQYKFYLALENSECTDYITEKFWIQSLVRGLVPIVFGPPRSDYEKVAPPGSFIHIKDFQTTRDLADYLRRVDSDDDLYNTYFQWKKKGSLKPYGGTSPNIMCQLGDRLEADEKAVQNRTYKPSKQKDWRRWWTGSCKSRGEIPQ